MRGNLAELDDVALWRQVVIGPIAPMIEDGPFLAEAARKLPDEPWDVQLAVPWGARAGRCSIPSGWL